MLLDSYPLTNPEGRVTTTISPFASSEASSQFSFVREHPAGSPESAVSYFNDKLAHECDPADLSTDLERKIPGLVVLDVRQITAFEECHIRDAISLPYRAISIETLSRFSENTLFVTYCWGPSCNAATKASIRIGKLGFKVKEMIGGIEYWINEGHPVEGTKTTER